MSTFWPLLKLQFFGLKMIVFYLQYAEMIFSDIIAVKNSDKIKFDFWTKFLWKMSIFWRLLKLQFFGLKMIVFYLKYPKRIFSDIISVKNCDKRKFDFWTKSMD